MICKCGKKMVCYDELEYRCECGVIWYLDEFLSEIDCENHKNEWLKSDRLDAVVGYSMSVFKSISKYIYDFRKEYGEVDLVRCGYEIGTILHDYSYDNYKLAAYYNYSYPGVGRIKLDYEMNPESIIVYPKDNFAEMSKDFSKTIKMMKKKHLFPLLTPEVKNG